MIAFTPHSTRCCGASSGYQFTTPDVVTLRAFDERLRQQMGKGGHLFECMLTDGQMRLWAPHLKERGFEVLRRWRNRNTGNYCNLVVKAPKTRTTPSYEW